MSSVRPAVIIAIGLMAVGIVTGCLAASPSNEPSGTATTPVATATQPHSAGPAAPTSPAAHPSIPPTAVEPVIVDCGQNGQVRPAAYVVTCADANNQLTNLRWTGWGPQTATGAGQASVNDCTPSCVAGQNHTYPVRVTLSNPTAWTGHKTVRFATMTIEYPGARPARTPAVVAIQLPG